MRAIQADVARSLRTVRVLRAVVERHSSLERAWASECARLPRAAQSDLRDLCSGSLRHLETYRYALSRLAAPLADDTPLQLLAAATAYELQHHARKPRSLPRRLAACCDALGRPAAAEEIAAAAAALARGGFVDHTAASALSLPAWLHAALAKASPLEAYGELCLRRPDFLGLHVGGGGAEAYARRLEEEGMEARASELAEGGVVVLSRPRDVAALPGVAEGRVHVQDLVQQWGVALLAPRGGRMLDACAAPGGKTRAWLSRRAEGEVLALERSERKARRMEALFREEPRVAVRCGDATAPAAWWDGKPFDAIIADVPCSATGIMRSRPEVKVHQTPETVEALQQTQLAILRALWPLLRRGGQLLYMTCSLLSTENEEVVRKFLKDKAISATIHLPPTPPSMLGSPLFQTHRHGVTIYPSTTHQGGFAALLEKNR
ncbi:hypothetical protein AB1Y20_005099 [Prymnesium parvum]|uniref:SAM-dependent MTase RsmB/NOP-type domain-containing protein n=1 Tax=Prymnesium parvum TaxID=97485 RepID=A0AB34J2D5_PRYPA